MRLRHKDRDRNFNDRNGGDLQRGRLEYHSRRQSATGKPAVIRACSLLPKADVKKIGAPNDQFFDMIPPTEESLGGGGSACSYSGIHIQVNPFTPAWLEELQKWSKASALKWISRVRNRVLPPRTSGARANQQPDRRNDQKWCGRRARCPSAQVD